MKIFKAAIALLFFLSIRSFADQNEPKTFVPAVACGANCKGNYNVYWGGYIDPKIPYNFRSIQNNIAKKMADDLSKKYSEKRVIVLSSKINNRKSIEFFNDKNTIIINMFIESLDGNKDLFAIETYIVTPMFTEIERDVYPLTDLSIIENKSEAASQRATTLLAGK